MAQSHIRDARPAHWKSIKKWKIRSVRRCAPNFCQDLGEASELTTNAQRAATALRVYRAHTERIQSVYRTHMLTNPTNAQRVVSAWNKWSAHAPRMHRAFNAQPATDEQGYGIVRHPPPIGHWVILGPRGKMPQSEGKLQARVEGLSVSCILLGDPRTHSG